MSLRRRALSAMTWSGADILLRQGLQFVVSVVLARLLSPAEFGTIALLYIFTGIAGTFVDSGMSAALIQRQDITQTDESTVFWFNLAVGSALAAILWASGPWIASFYGLPVLAPLAGVMGLNVLIGALGSIHGTLLTKRLEFRVQLKLGAAASLLSGGTAMWMASRGYGMWALAAQSVVATACTTTLLWVANPWRPTREFSVASARRLFAYGGYLLATGLLDTIYNRLYTVLIGKMFGVRELGYFSRADNAKQMPVGVVAGILSRVAFPIFSSAAGDTAKLRRGVQLSVRGMMLVNLPMMLGLAALADPIVVAIYGVAWRPAAPMLEVLCLAGIFWPLHVINVNVLMAQGHSNLLLRTEIAKKVVGAAILAAGSLLGIMGIAWSMVLLSVWAFAINAYYTGRLLDYGALEQVKDALPVLGVSLAMGAAVRGFSSIWKVSPVVAAPVLVLVGAAIFVSLCWALDVRAFRDAERLVRQGGEGR